MPLVGPELDLKEEGGGGSTSSGFKFKPSSITTFYCPGVSTFSEYLDLVGINTDVSGYLDVTQLLTTHKESGANLSSRLKDYYYYSDGTNLYNTWDGNTYPMDCVGYIRLPFKVNNSRPYIVLPGTTPHFNGFEILNASSNDWSISRNSNNLVVTNLTTGSVSTISKYSFPEGVVPILAAAIAQGGGGGGGCSKSTYSGCGGGGGGAAFGIINLAAASNVIIYVGSGGSGGVKDDFNGKHGGSTQILAGSGGSLTGSGGGGGGSDSSGRGGLGGEASAENLVDGVPIWPSTSGSTPDYQSAYSWGGNGGMGPGGTASDHGAKGKCISTVTDRSLFSSPNRMFLGMGGLGTSQTTAGITVYGGGGGGASPFGYGGGGGVCWVAGGSLEKAKAYPGANGGGGGGGGFSTGLWVPGAAGGDGFAEITY